MHDLTHRNKISHRMRYTHCVDILKSPLTKSLVLFGSAAGLSSCGSSSNANATQATPSIDKQETIEVLHSPGETNSTQSTLEKSTEKEDAKVHKDEFDPSSIEKDLSWDEEIQRLRMYKALDIPNSPAELAEIEAAQKKYAPVFDTRTEQEKKDFIAQGLMKRDDLFALGYGVTAKLLELGGDKEINKLVKKIQDKYTLSEAQADDIFYQAFHQGTMEIKADGSVSMAPLVKDPETGRNYYSGGVWTQDGKFIGSMDQRREEYRAKTGLPKDVVSPIQLMEAARVAEAIIDIDSNDDQGNTVADNLESSLEELSQIKSSSTTSDELRQAENVENDIKKMISIFRSTNMAAQLMYGIDAPKKPKVAEKLFHAARKDLLHFGVWMSKSGSWLNKEEFVERELGLSQRDMVLVENIMQNLAKEIKP